MFPMGNSTEFKLVLHYYKEENQQALKFSSNNP